MLKVWFPGTDDIEDYGLGNSQWVNDNVTISNNGKLGKCLSFNGSNSRLSTTNFNLSNEWSFCFWAKCNNASSGWMALWALGDNNDSNVTAGYFLIPTQSRSQISFNGTYNSGLSLPSSTEWTHYAGSWDGTKLIYYINGTQVYQNTYTTTYLQKTHLTIGGESNDSTDGGHGAIRIPFNGLINDFRIYDDYILSPREVKQVSTALVLHYPLAMPGQENLYTGSRDFSGTWVSGANWTTDSEQYNGFVVKKKSSIWGGLAQNVPCSNGDIFTISFYAKVDSGGNILSIHRSSLGNVTTGLTILGGNFKSGTDWVTASDDGTEWKRYWATVEITSQDITYLQWRIENSVANKFLYVCGMKLERGSVATPWMPNSSDAAYTTLGFNDGIEYDVSGYGNNGTKVGTITYDSDTPRYNTSTILNGTYISLASLTNSTISQFSICGWVNLLTGYTANYGCHLINFNKTYCRICVSKDGAALKILLTDGTTNYTLASVMTASSLSANVWNHYAVTFDNGSIKIYINGQLDRSAQAAITAISPSTSSWTIGNHGTTEFPKATVSDVRFYTTALSADDILELYHTPETLSHNGTLLTQGELVES